MYIRICLACRARTRRLTLPVLSWTGTSRPGFRTCCTPTSPSSGNSAHLGAKARATEPSSHVSIISLRCDEGAFAFTAAGSRQLTAALGAGAEVLVWTSDNELEP